MHQDIGFHGLARIKHLGKLIRKVPLKKARRVHVLGNEGRAKGNVFAVKVEEAAVAIGTKLGAHVLGQIAAQHEQPILKRKKPAVPRNRGQVIVAAIGKILDGVLKI